MRNKVLLRPLRIILINIAMGQGNPEFKGKTSPGKACLAPTVFKQHAQQGIADTLRGERYSRMLLLTCSRSF
jgi:hypothetical protein